MTQLTSVLFFAAVGVGFVAWIFNVVEIIALLCFAKWVFAVGPRVHEARIADAVLTNLNSKGSLAEFRYRRVTSDKLLVREVFPVLRLGLISLFKGTLQSGDGVQLTLRAPLGLVLFFASWLAACCLGAFHAALKGEWAMGMGMLVVALAIGSGLYVVARVGRRLFVERLSAHLSPYGPHS